MNINVDAYEVITFKEDLKSKGDLWLLPGVPDILQACFISACALPQQHTILVPFTACPCPFKASKHTWKHCSLSYKEFNYY
jgi:hypothetical protein